MNVADHIGLVGTVAKRYGNLMPYEDMVQEGVLGLMRAASKFDPNLGLAFSTYASYWVRHFIQRAITDRTRTIRIPVHKHETLRRAGELPTEPTSLDREVRDQGSAHAFTLHDLVPDDSPDVDSLAADAEEQTIVRREVARLSEKEQTILRMRFVEELTLEEVGAHFNCTRQRIQQIEAKALSKLRPRLERAL